MNLIRAYVLMVCGIAGVVWLEGGWHRAAVVLAAGTAVGGLLWVCWIFVVGEP